MKECFRLLTFVVFVLSPFYRSFSQTTTFSFISAPQSWMVPAGVSYILVDAQAARGGAAGPVGATIGTTTPGCGGRVQAILAVTPGEVLDVNVGGAGQDAVGYIGSSGGYNGGGYTTPWVPSVPTYAGGGGGGQSDISASGVTLLVAGGGGGAGYNGSCATPDQPGGNGGGLTGASSTTCDATLTTAGFTTITHAGGGRQTIGGVGGYLCCGDYYAGTAGTLSLGGNNVDSGGVGGGGGGGYYGGGGGCWSGGGGGSSYTNPAFASGVTHTQGYNCTGDGIVTICILPDPGTLTGRDTLCAAANTTLADTSTGGTWMSSNNAIATVSASGIVYGVAGGTAIISYTMTNSCGTSAATMVETINPLPNAGVITGKDSVCPGHKDTLANVVAGGAWSTSGNIIATVGSGTGMVTGVIPGNDTVFYTVTTGGCTNRAMLVLVVRAHSECLSEAPEVEAMTRDALRIVPNPNTGIFTVTFESINDEPAWFTITNIVGERVKVFTARTNVATSLQLDEPPGVYFITASTQASKQAAKVIVVK